MDLFEYQARDLFEKHGVPVLGGAVATTADEARAAAEKSAPRAAACVVKAQVKTGGRGKAGGVKLAKTRRRGGRRRRADPRHGHQGPHRPPGDGRPGARRSPRSTTSRSCSTAPTAPTSRWPAREGGMEIEQLAVERPEALARVAVDPIDGHRRRQGRARSSTPAGFPADVARPGRRRDPEAVGGLRRRGRHAGRGQPAGQDRRRPDRRPRRQGHPGRERRLPPPRPRGARGQGRGRPARGGGQGQGPQLRQARRRGRHHRQRRRAWSCRTLDVVAYAGEEFPAASSRPTSSTSAAAPRPR